MTGSLGRPGGSRKRDRWVNWAVLRRYHCLPASNPHTGRTVIRRHAFWFRSLLMIADAIVSIALLISLSAWRFGPDWAIWWRTIVPEPIAFAALYAATWITMLTLFGLYRPRARWSLRSEATDVLRATGLMALVTLSVLFWFKLPDVSRLLLLVLFPAQAIVTIGIRAAMRWFMERERRRGRNLRFVLVIGAGERARAFAAKLDLHPELGLRVIGFLASDGDEGTDRTEVLGPVDALEEVLHSRIVDEVAICLPFSQWSVIDALASLCEEEGKIVRIPMDMMDRAIATGRLEDLDGTPVYSLVSGPDRALSLAVKRGVDVAGSLAGMVLLSPVFAAIAVAVLLDDGRPVFFRQTRVGLHGRRFQLAKFRTMAVGAEERREELASQNTIQGPAFKLENDPRVTPVGRFLRRTSLDELPQLQSVLLGDMSLVGPRPPLPTEVAGYDLWHRRRLSMKPGITGLWQVRGRRDPEFNRWVEADLEYIDRWSLWLDLQILVRTVPAALDGR